MSLLERSLSGAALILCVCLIRMIGLRRLPPFLFSILWAAVLVRLLWPGTFSSPLGIWNQPSALSAAAAMNAQGKAFSLTALQWAWIFGALVAFATFTLLYIRQRRVFSTALPATLPPLDKASLKSPGAAWKVRIFTSDRIGTPLTYGFIRPKILIPKGLSLSPEELHCVLAHEYAHILRGDALFRLLMAAALCIHWFNPLVWLMAYLYGQDMELACDHQVAGRLNAAQRARYARTLLTLEEKKPFSGVLFNYFSQSPMETRIRNLFHQERRSKLAAAAAVAAFSLALFVFAASASGTTAMEMTKLILQGTVNSQPLVVAGTASFGGSYFFQPAIPLQAASAQRVKVISIAAKGEPVKSISISIAQEDTDMPAAQAVTYASTYIVMEE